MLAWLARHPRWTFHFTPTSCSWLNAVEGFFAKLTKRRLKRGVFRSVVDLQAAINRFVDEDNHDPKPFIWTADPDKIIAAVNQLCGSGLRADAIGMQQIANGDAPDASLRLARPAHDLNGAKTVRRQQHDLGPPGMLLDVAVTDDRPQAAAIDGGEGDGDTRAHAPESHGSNRSGIAGVDSIKFRFDPLISDEAAH